MGGNKSLARSHEAEHQAVVVIKIGETNQDITGFRSRVFVLPKFRLQGRRLLRDLVNGIGGVFLRDSRQCKTDSTYGNSSGTAKNRLRSCSAECGRGELEVLHYPPACERASEIFLASLARLLSG